jgi:putative tryptophan/tyrosine transport system substrate-binding protein
MREKRLGGRRLAAILAADVAGYSRLTRLDEEGTITRLRTLRRELIDPAMDAFGGRITRTIQLAVLPMRRRDFLAGLMLICAMASARAQQVGRVRRIGVLLTIDADSAERKRRVGAFSEALASLGWVENRNVEIAYRFAGGDPERARRYAAELVAEAPDVILANGSAIVRDFREKTQTIPIVFVLVPDPVGDGLVASLARPGTNMTGLTNFEFSMGGKWVEILQELAPMLNRVGLLYNPQTAPYTKYFLAAIAATNRVEPVQVAVHDPSEIDQSIASLSAQPNTGLIVVPDLFTVGHYELIVKLVRQHPLPTIYPFRYFVDKGGLISYGIDVVDVFRQAATYVDRILRGEKPGKLPVQAPSKFELVINLNTAKTQGLSVPQSLLSTADEVIE